MPTISILAPDATGNPHAVPLAANGTFTKDLASHTVTITGTATCTHGGNSHAVPGVLVNLGKSIWEMTFAVDAGASVSFTVNLTDSNGGTASDSATGLTT